MHWALKRWPSGKWFSNTSKSFQSTPIAKISGKVLGPGQRRSRKAHMLPWNWCWRFTLKSTCWHSTGHSWCNCRCRGSSHNWFWCVHFHRIMLSWFFFSFITQTNHAHLQSLEFFHTTFPFHHSGWANMAWQSKWSLTEIFLTRVCILSFCQDSVLPHAISFKVPVIHILDVLLGQLSLLGRPTPNLWYLLVLFSTSLLKK